MGIVFTDERIQVSKGRNLLLNKPYVGSCQSVKEFSEKLFCCATDMGINDSTELIESIYENARVIELRRRGLTISQQIEVVITYDRVEVGKHRLDLLIEDTIIVELKAVKNLESIHFAVVKSYLRAKGLKHGLILNFAKVTLEVRRVMAE